MELTNVLKFNDNFKLDVLINFVLRREKKVSNWVNISLNKHIFINEMKGPYI